jgi:hypothetical protein
MSKRTICSRLKASPIADEMAVENRFIAMTSDLMFFGALVNAYSRLVMEAKISERAMST